MSQQNAVKSLAIGPTFISKNHCASPQAKQRVIFCWEADTGNFKNKANNKPDYSKGQREQLFSVRDVRVNVPKQIGDLGQLIDRNIEQNMILLHMFDKTRKSACKLSDSTVLDFVTDHYCKAVPDTFHRGWIDERLPSL